MLTITFKNVADGDTTILEWRNDNGENEIGVIDCQLRDGESNPVVEHIKKKGYRRINFMILTHPHTDHFSGFPSLLEFCKEQGIEIGTFWHTAVYNKSFLKELADNRITDGKITVNEFLDSFVSRINDRNRLKKLFMEIDALWRNQTLKDAGAANSDSLLRLNEKLWLECLSPSDYDELKQYYMGFFNLEPEEKMRIRKRENNPKANLLSLFIRIGTAKWSVLLPSNCTKSTIKRIAKNRPGCLDTKVVALQIPNHGSLQSHFEPFWANIPGKENVPVFVSISSRYGWPDSEVIEFFDKNYKGVHSTNFVGGFKDYFCEKYKISAGKGIDVNPLFDMYNAELSTSKKSPIEHDNPDYCGEKQILINEDGTYRIFTNP